uniref:Homeobox domain-containing protein n=1 Tax=Daucus carota subsp. sativus TaxID=79200 RepID=A0A162AK02_DAUCS
MSQDYHHQAAGGIFSFSNGYERSQEEQRDKVLRGQGFEPPPPLVAMDEEGGEETGGGLHGYDQTAGLLSEMFNFPSGAATATELLQQQISGNYHGHIMRPSSSHLHREATGPSHENWYTGNEHKSSHIVNQQHIGPSINASDSAAAAMQLFHMNPSSARSPSPPPSTLHMLLPNPSPNPTSNSLHQGFHSPGAFGPSSHQQQFTWGTPGSTGHDAGSTSTTGQLTPHHHPIIEGHGQGLSLSLSSSLQHLEAAKAEEFRNAGGSGGMLFFNQGGGGPNTNSQFHNQALQLQGTEVVLGAQNQPIHHVGFRSSSSLGVVNVLRTSKYVKAAQELLEEFCSVGRGQFKKNKFPKPPNPTGSSGAGTSTSSAKDPPPLSASDRIEHQRRKVDRRYSHYCQQMQMVVNSFDVVMGYGAAVPYTALAQKAMSRHFRCLKDAIAAQIKHSCELLGEKDAAGTSGVTKGETPRLKLLEQSLRQQRAFHQMGGMLEQEAWRPQRGLPERSVNILRAWLFEHFLHPYPSDADKHLLARQTGLSRNQVSNWFINARVRLWKPMVEDMYQQESKEEGDEDEETETNAQTPMQSSTLASTAPSFTSTPPSTTVPINAPESDPSLLAINTTFSENQPPSHLYSASTTPLSTVTCHRRGDPEYTAAPNAEDHSNNMGSTLISFGANATGDVSLTLGLRHVGNMPEKNPFSVRDFEGC